MAFILPTLPYSSSSLEPFYDKATLEIHHGLHHAGYVAKLNQALDFYPKLAEVSVEELLSNLNSLPTEIRNAVAHNGGGHANHSLFWRTMEPKHEGSTFGDLARAIPDTFGTFTNFKEQFTTLSLDVFGSGWTWLSVSAQGKLTLSNTSNQDSPLSYGAKPILCLDLWEHAYYLKFQNRRLEWIESWWNLVNWREVSTLYTRILSGATTRMVYADNSQLVDASV
jgi:Fe-Mn family superoxide dismutase